MGAMCESGRAGAGACRGALGGSRGGRGEGGDFIRQESHCMKTAQAPNNFEK